MFFGSSRSQPSHPPPQHLAHHQHGCSREHQRRDPRLPRGGRSRGGRPQGVRRCPPRARQRRRPRRREGTHFQLLRWPRVPSPRRARGDEGGHGQLQVRPPVITARTSSMHLRHHWNRAPRSSRSRSKRAERSEVSDTPLSRDIFALFGCALARTASRAAASSRSSTDRFLSIRFFLIAGVPVCP